MAMWIALVKHTFTHWGRSIGLFELVKVIWTGDILKVRD